MIFADTSGLLALLDEGEAAHAPCVKAASELAPPIVTTDFVLAETDFLLTRRLGAKAERDFLDQLLAGAVLREPVRQDDIRRALEILSHYEDQCFGLTDATSMAIAERLAAPVLTLDRRHFALFRTSRGSSLTLVP